MPGIYFDEYNDLTVAKQKNTECKYDPTNLFLEENSCDSWFENEESSDLTRKTDKEERLDLSDMLQLEGDKKS